MSLRGTEPSGEGETAATSAPAGPARPLRTRTKGSRPWAVCLLCRRPRLWLRPLAETTHVFRPANDKRQMIADDNLEKGARRRVSQSNAGMSPTRRP